MTLKTLIGRDYALTEKLAKLCAAAVDREHSRTTIREVERGFSFDVELWPEKRWVKGTRPTGHICHVVVTLDRVEDRRDPV